MKAVKISMHELEMAEKDNGVTARKSCNIANVKHYLAAAIKDAGMEISAVLAEAKAKGRAMLSDAQIKAALESKGWTTDGDVGGTMMRCGDGSSGIQTDHVAARDLLAWMLGK